MGPGMFDGIGKAIGCALICAFLLGILATSCVKACPYRFSVERVAPEVKP